MSLHLYDNSISITVNPTSMNRSFVVLSAIIVAFAVVFFFQISLFSLSRIQAQESSRQESIRICCAWGDKLADGILTYKIVGGSSTDSVESKQAVYNAINDWNSKLHGIRLVEVSSDSRGEKNNNDDYTPDLQIKLSSKIPRTRVSEIISGDTFSPSGAKTRLSTQGVSYIKRDSNGFITNILITIFTSDPFGNALLSSSPSFDPSKIETITKHEIGHALGIGHSNLISDLMYPVINSRTNTGISDCDIHAVSEANSWKLIESSNNNNDPQPPSVGRVHC